MQKLTEHTMTNESEQERRREKWPAKTRHSSTPTKGCICGVNTWSRL